MGSWEERIFPEETFHLHKGYCPVPVWMPSNNGYRPLWALPVCPGWDFSLDRSTLFESSFHRPFRFFLKIRREKKVVANQLCLWISNANLNRFHYHPCWHFWNTHVYLSIGSSFMKTIQTGPSFSIRSVEHGCPKRTAD